MFSDLDGIISTGMARTASQLEQEIVTYENRKALGLPSSNDSGVFVTHEKSLFYPISISENKKIYQVGGVDKIKITLLVVGILLIGLSALGTFQIFFPLHAIKAIPFILVGISGISSTYVLTAGIVNHHIMKKEIAKCAELIQQLLTENETANISKIKDNLKMISYKRIQTQEYTKELKIYKLAIALGCFNLMIFSFSLSSLLIHGFPLLTLITKITTISKDGLLGIALGSGSIKSMIKRKKEVPSFYSTREDFYQESKFYLPKYCQIQESINDAKNKDDLFEIVNNTYAEVNTLQHENEDTFRSINKNAEINNTNILSSLEKINYLPDESALLIFNQLRGFYRQAIEEHNSLFLKLSHEMEALNQEIKDLLQINSNNGCDRIKIRELFIHVNETRKLFNEVLEKQAILLNISDKIFYILKPFIDDNDDPNDIEDKLQKILKFASSDLKKLLSKESPSLSLA